jgi:hypothetical protein
MQHTTIFVSMQKKLAHHKFDLFKKDFLVEFRRLRFLGQSIKPARAGLFWGPLFGGIRAFHDVASILSFYDILSQWEMSS